MAASATQPPWAQQQHDDDDDAEDDGVDPIGRNTLKLRSRAIVDAKASGAPLQMPPSAYPSSGRGTGENLYGSGSYAQQKPAATGFSGEAARFAPPPQQPYHPQHPPPYPRAYPMPQQSSLGGGGQPPQPQQQHQLPSMGQKRWEINDEMMHQSWGEHSRTPSRPLPFELRTPPKCAPHASAPRVAGTVLRTLNRS